LHLDELDKLPFEAPQEWSRAVTNEVWAVLDGELPLERFLNDPDLKSIVDDGARAELARPDFFSRVFIIGSGTWQSVHDHANRPARIVGFGAQVAPASARREVLDALGETRGIASELLARFDGEILFLSPPTVSEALAILEELGIADFSTRRRIDLAALLAELLPRQGFRALESVVTRVLLAGWRPPMPVPRPRAIPEPAPVIDETWSGTVAGSWARNRERFFP
jgi:DNA-binding transcriptional ArsR family regulator